MTGKTISPRRHWRSLLFGSLAAAISLVPIEALADSTTGTSLSITGTPTPGKAVTAHVTVTGKHLVDGPGFTVNGGVVQVTVNGVLAAQIRAAWPANSNQIDSGCVQYDSYNNCIRIKHISSNTDVTLSVSLPVGATSYAITAAYTGDADSHGSTSQSILLKPVYPGADAAINLLLND